MKDKKLQIFVSSTYTDLKEERQAAVEAILSSGHIPAGMELFSAGDESQMAVIERWIDESDVYLLILGGRYGSIDKKTGKSYTQLEFEYASAKKKPLFAVVITEEALESRVKALGSYVLEQDNAKELKEFRSNVLNNLVRFWEDKKDIKIAIHETISEFTFRKGLIGWIRGDNFVNTAFLAEEIAKLTNENSELRKKINNDASINALYSQLTYEQLEELLKRESVEIENDKINLFDYILRKGKILTDGLIISGMTDEIRDKLKVFKLIVTGPNSKGYRSYKFTEDGHNFYLKALFLSESK